MDPDISPALGILGLVLLIVIIGRAIVIRFFRFHILLLLTLLLPFPLFVFPPLNWALGATQVRFGSYVAGSALGVIPCLALVVYFGGSLAEANATGDYLSAEVLIPAALLGGVLVWCSLSQMVD